MWGPTNDDSVECVSLEIENLTELLDLMLSNSERMGNKQITALLGLCLNLSSGIFFMGQRRGEASGKRRGVAP